METKDFDQDFIDLIKYWDPKLKRLQESYYASRNRSWIVSLLLGPFTEIKSVFNFLRNKNFELLSFVYTTPITLGLGYFGLKSSYIISLLGGEQVANHYLIGFLAFFWYMITLTIHFFRMADLNSACFHIGVYSILRKPEYEMILPFVHEGRKFSFEAMKNWFYSNQGKYTQLSNRQDEWVKQKADYDRVISELEELLVQTLEHKNQIISEKTNYANYISQILEKAKINVERFVNGRFNSYDIGFFGPYTLYELQEDRLKLKFDVGTDANAQKEIILSEHPEYITVRVLSHFVPYMYQRVGRNRTILSYRMIMPDQKIWIINFHINENDDKLMKLFFRNGLIDSLELLEIVRVYCYLLQMYGPHSTNDLDFG